ncbi:MAG: thiamine-phosphate kinase, partial [Hyphomicrobiales bacterium]|nr:thiamine-phosphate kinase [Hyphomicrobiales bacterium]
DAALVRLPDGFDLVITNDALVADVHFFAADPPFEIARKALRVNLSDLAAKGAVPVGFLLALMLPKGWQAQFPEDWLAQFAQGLGADSAEFGIALLGGDTVETSGPLSLSITALGQVPAGKMVPRTGVRAGDGLYVSGTIGDAALGLAIRLGRLGGPLPPEHSQFLTQRYLVPQPRMGLAGPLQAFARGAMDVSDGFVGDLAKMLRASNVGGRLDLSAVPISEAARAAMVLQPDLWQSALTGGDDYEVLCAIEPQKMADFEKAAADAGVKVARIGVATADPQVIWQNADGSLQTFSQDRYQHF